MKTDFSIPTTRNTKIPASPKILASKNTVGPRRLAASTATAMMARQADAATRNSRRVSRKLWPMNKTPTTTAAPKSAAAHLGKGFTATPPHRDPAPVAGEFHPPDKGLGRAGVGPLADAAGRPLAERRPQARVGEER